MTGELAIGVLADGSVDSSPGEPAKAYIRTAARGEAGEQLIEREEAEEDWAVPLTVIVSGPVAWIRMRLGVSSSLPGGCLSGQRGRKGQILISEISSVTMVSEP